MLITIARDIQRLFVQYYTPPSDTICPSVSSNFSVNSQQIVTKKITSANLLYINERTKFQEQPGSVDLAIRPIVSKYLF